MTLNKTTPLDNHVHVNRSLLSTGWFKERI